MSAFLGIFNLNGKPVAEHDMQPALNFFGQFKNDGCALWTSGPIGFGHQMQAVTPESSQERLPLTRDNLTITADARIDNRDDLFAALDIAHADRRTMTDNELILLAYRKWGDSCPERLIGDYAFAIWDERNQNVFCARDHIGVKPFYYYQTSEIFAFASDLRGLIALEGVRSEIDEAEIARYLLYQGPGYNDNTYTFFKNIYKLPYAHKLTANRQAVRTSSYWTPTEYPEIRLASLDDYADALFDVIQQAVNSRLRTNLHVGAHLSGGLDSSAVAILANRTLKERDHQPDVFSWSPPPGDNSDQTEHGRINAMCLQEGLTPVYIESSVEHGRMMGKLDISLKPSYTASNEDLVQQKAVERGIGLMMSGWGGDETVSFNARGLHAELFANRQWRQLEHHFGFHKARSPRKLAGTARRFWKNAVVPTLPAPMYRFMSYRGLRNGNWTKPYINPDFLEYIGPMIRPSEPPKRETPGVKANQFGLFYSGHMTARMESWASFGLEHGLTYVYPLVDRRVLEFIYAIPGHLHHEGGVNRHLYRYTMARIMPKGVPWQPVKQDTAMFEHAAKLRDEGAKSNRDYWLNDERLKQPNPWVDVPRLSKSLITNTPERHTGAAQRNAINSLTIWQNWKRGNTQSVAFENSEGFKKGTMKYV